MGNGKDKIPIVRVSDSFDGNHTYLLHLPNGPVEARAYELGSINGVALSDLDLANLSGRDRHTVREAMRGSYGSA